MISEIENKPSLNEISDLEFDKNKLEMMRYRANGLSYILGFGAILCSVMAAFVCLNSLNPNSVLVIIKILLNVFVLLFGFLCCEKAKSYSIQGSYMMIGLGAICIARMFWIPLQLIVNFNKFMTALDGRQKALDAQDMAKVDEWNSKISSYKNVLGKITTSYYDGNDNTIRWLSANGNFRGVLAIVFLACAAALFIAAGVIGVTRSKKLAGYLNSLNIKKD